MKACRDHPKEKRLRGEAIQGGEQGQKKSDDSMDRTVETEPVPKEWEEQMAKMLNGLNFDQFMKLTASERQRVYKRYLVKPARKVFIMEGDDAWDEELNPHVAPGVLLTEEWMMDRSESGRRIKEEAEEAFYGGNHFEVMVDGLGEFSSSWVRMGESQSIKHLIRRIQINVGLDRIRKGGLEEENRWILKELNGVRGFVNAKEIRIQIRMNGINYIIEDWRELSSSLVKEAKELFEILEKELGEIISIEVVQG